MVWYAAQDIQLKPIGGNSGESSSCIPTLIGFFIGDSRMKQIPLTQGKFALVDDEGYKRLSEYSWHAQKQPNAYYACRDIGSPPNRIRLKMHRVIMCAKKGEDVDHRDCNGLNNQKYNLRRCTRSQNIRYSRKRKGCTSIFKGVHWHVGADKWQAKIFVDGKAISLGLYFDEVEAAKAYDEAAMKYFGKFARLN